MAQQPLTHLPPHKRAAPGGLELIRGFLNTLDIDDGIEALDSPEALAAWLAEHELLDPRARLDRADLERAVEVREALRKLLLANNGAPLDPGALETLNRVGDSAAMVVRFDGGGGSELAPVRAGIDGALARMLGIVARAMAEGTWSRLKACPDPTCHWAFYDYSKNRSGHWCSMAVCGNRNKARAYRERQRRGGG
jgi:predicted RNA-binding Zn ribbon-like protein